VNTTKPIEVTVLFLEGGHASTAVGPLEVFRDAGVLWNELAGEPHAPRFRVRSASIDGAPVCPGPSEATPYSIRPDDALDAVADSDLVFVSSGGLPIAEVIARNGPIVDFLRQVHARGARVAGVCSGVSLLGAAGLLDGRAATTHWALVDELRTRFPSARWQPDDLVTEEDGVYCGGGVHAALDLALYLVDRLAGRDIARECAKALVLDMPRECQAGFSVLPVGASHDDEPIRRAERWIHGHCREGRALRRARARARHEPAQLHAPVQGRHGHDGARLSPAPARARGAAHARGRSPRGCGGGRRVGYEDAAFFRALFKRHTGLSPAAYRRRFGAVPS
jgi:transcriptional regulator GlxA family with amidase domain